MVSARSSRGVLSDSELMIAVLELSGKHVTRGARETADDDPFLANGPTTAARRRQDRRPLLWRIGGTNGFRDGQLYTSDVIGVRDPLRMSGPARQRTKKFASVVLRMLKMRVISAVRAFMTVSVAAWPTIWMKIIWVLAFVTLANLKSVEQSVQLRKS